MIQSHLRDCPPSLRMSKPHERGVATLDRCRREATCIWRARHIHVTSSVDIRQTRNVHVTKRHEYGQCVTFIAVRVTKRHEYGQCVTFIARTELIARAQEGRPSLRSTIVSCAANADASGNGLPALQCRQSQGPLE